MAIILPLIALAALGGFTAWQVRETVEAAPEVVDIGKQLGPLVMVGGGLYLASKAKGNEKLVGYGIALLGAMGMAGYGLGTIFGGKPDTTPPPAGEEEALLRATERGEEPATIGETLAGGTMDILVSQTPQQIQEWYTTPFVTTPQEMVTTSTGSLMDILGTFTIPHYQQFQQSWGNLQGWL